MTGWKLPRARVAGLVVALGALLIGAWVHWKNADSLASVQDLPALPVGARYETKTWNADDWIREKYIEMVSPIRPPSSVDGKVRIVVYVRPAHDRQIRAVQFGGDWTLELPAGSKSDRVEFYGSDATPDAAPSSSWRVLDVRGITFESAGQRLRVLRPASATTRELLGIEWLRGEQQDAVTSALGDLVLRGGIAGPNALDDRRRAAAHLQGLNDCASCHIPNRRGRKTVDERGVVNRFTDASGLFQVTSIFRNRLPFETYRPRDMNVGDRFVSRACGSMGADESTARCSNGSVLEGELNVREGLQARDVHTQRVCASRRALAEHFDAAALVAFRAALEECDVAHSQ